MDSGLLALAFERRQVRITERDGVPWFVAKDVCDVLGLENARQALVDFPENEKSSVTINDGTSPMGGNPNFNIINEPGLYRLIFKSRKPEAEAFKTWVFNEVLPVIRRTGAYGAPAALEQRFEAAVNRLEALQTAALPSPERFSEAERLLGVPKDEFWKVRQLKRLADTADIVRVFVQTYCEPGGETMQDVFTCWLRRYGTYRRRAKFVYDDLNEERIRQALKTLGCRFVTRKMDNGARIFMIEGVTLRLDRIDYYPGG